MQKRLRENLENAIFVGIAALLLVSLLYIIGGDIHARAISNGEILTVDKARPGPIYLILITISSISFVIFSFRALFLGFRLNEEEEIKVRNFVFSCMTRGYTREEAIEMLEKKGWEREEIDRILN